MVKLEWGTKRQCQGCAARFYDLMKTPPTCPKCGEVYEIQQLSRRGKRGVQDDVKADDIVLDADLGLVDDLDTDLVDDDIIEDTDDLAEDIDDMAEVIHVHDDKDHL